MHNLRRILLAEDDPNDAELTLMALAEYHLANEVLTASDGAEALDFLFRRGKYAGRNDAQPGVILLDVKMPKINGIEVLRQIKSDPQLRTVPVVMLTSSREETDLVESYNLGANAYVVKPVDFHAFAEAVKRLGVFWALVNEPPPDSFSSHPISESGAQAS
jgi:CheY-like chemotaxis protein